MSRALTGGREKTSLAVETGKAKAQRREKAQRVWGNAGSQLEPRWALDIEARGSSSQKVLRLKPEWRFHPAGSEEPESGLERERKSSGQGVSGGRWRWPGQATARTEQGALSGTAAAGRPRLGRPGAQSRDLTLQASGLPAAPTLKTRGPFPGSEDPSQLGPWSGSKANRKSRRWARLGLFLCLEKGLGQADLDLWVFPSKGGRGLQASQGHGEVQFRGGGTGPGGQPSRVPHAWPSLANASPMEGTGSTRYVTLGCRHSLCHRAQVAALPWALGFPLVSLGHQPGSDGVAASYCRGEVHTAQTRALGTGL